MVKRPNTTGCEPVTHGFESRYSPHYLKIGISHREMLFLYLFVALYHIFIFLVSPTKVRTDVNVVNNLIYKLPPC